LPGYSSRRTDAGKGKRGATTHYNPNQTGSWRIDGPASIAAVITNMMGHLWHETAPMHHNRLPKISEYGYSSVRRGKPPRHGFLLRESNG